MDDDAAVERARVRGRPSLGSCALAGWWCPRPRRRSCSNKAILRRDGVSYLIETIHFNSTSRKSPCSRTDDFDIASLAFSSLAAAVLNGHMDDFRVVADGFQDGVEGHYSGDYLVLRESPIKTVEDLWATPSP